MVCQAAGDWRPCSCRALLGHHLLILCWTNPAMRNKIKGPTLCEGTKINVKSQNAVQATTGWGLLWHSQVLRRSVSKIFFWLVETPGSPSRLVWKVKWKFQDPYWLKFCCNFVETLEGSTQWACESDDYNLTSKLITMLSDDLFNYFCCPKVYFNLKLYK